MNWLYFGAVAYGAGVYLGLLNYTLYDFQWLALLWSIFGLTAIWLLKRTSKVFFIAIMLSLFSTGIFFGLGGGYAKYEIGNLFYKKISVVGRIDPFSVNHADYGDSCIVIAEKIYTDKLVSETPVKIRISVQNTLPESGVIAVKGTLKPLHVMRNPGTFDMEIWNRVQGLGGRIRSAEWETITNENFSIRNITDYLAIKNRQCKQYLQENIPGEAGVLLGNILLGGNRGLTDETREIFANNGISHLLAVSGTHILFLVSVLTVILNFIKNKWRQSIIVAILVLYVALCGFRPSVLRGFFMSLPLILNAEGVERGRLLTIIAVIFLTLNPLWLLDVGFQLSFAAAAGILWLGPKLRGYFHLVFPYTIAELFTITAAAQLATLPLLVHYFHQFSCLVFLSGLILIPFLELGVLAALAVAIMQYCLETSILMDFSGLVIRQTLIWAEMLGRMTFFNVILPLQPVLTWVLYGLFLLFLFDFSVIYFIPFLWRRRLVGVWGGLFLTVITCTIFWPRGNRLYFLDVGQGDAAVFISEKNETVVIDTGGVLGFDVGSRVLTPFLYGEGIRKIDVLLLSHGDLDHAGGAAGLARNIPIRQIILPQGDKSESILKLLKVAEKTNIVHAKKGETIKLSEASLEILAAPELGKGNAVNVVAELNCKGERVLFAGDTDWQQEQQLNLQGGYAVLKASHHGSKYSNSQQFLEMVHPKNTVISVGRDNGYGHPHREMLERLKATGTKIYRTDYSGMVKFRM
ncbi:MAG: DNA internalization-related competence protein ComEC/Rec2 [Acidaminococcaceae bacterium]|nr:DNA internalization-related competence protein ComEC/Rec2 [Acidaminococcaceae bacterium]